MNHSLGISSSGVKFALHLVHFMINCDFNSERPQNISFIFNFSSLELRVVENRARNF